MARGTAEAKLDTRTARRKLEPRNEPYWNSVQSGLHIGYRRNEGQSAGVWYARFTPRKGEGILSQRKVFKRLGSADDNVDADQLNTFTYEQARREAVAWLPTATDIATGEKPRVRAALYSGCRYGELSRLNVQDFHARAGTLFVAESKSGRPRTVYLDSEGIMFFSTLCEGKRSSDAILPKGDGKRWEKDDAKGMMETACIAGTIEPCTIHELRHTAASRWIENGLSLPEVAEQLGHSDIRMVSRHYGHLSKATLAKRMRSMKPLGISSTPGVVGDSPATDQRTTIQ
jgi:integrase